MRFCSRIVFRGMRNEEGGMRILKSQSNLTPRSSLPTPRLRDEYPFLNEPDCPVELQALVTRKVTDYHRYQQLYGELRDCADIDELSEKSGQLLDAYLDNQAIKRELDYYQKNHRVLGRHPMFKHFQELSRLRSMSVRDLIREQDKVKNNIWRVNSEIRKGDKPQLDGKRQQKLQMYEQKLSEINRLLGE